MLKDLVVLALVGAALSVDVGLRDAPIVGDSVTYMDGQWDLTSDVARIKG